MRAGKKWASLGIGCFLFLVVEMFVGSYFHWMDWVINCDFYPRDASCEKWGWIRFPIFMLGGCFGFFLPVVGIAAGLVNWGTGEDPWE